MLGPSAEPTAGLHDVARGAGRPAGVRRARRATVVLLVAALAVVVLAVAGVTGLLTGSSGEVGAPTRAQVDSALRAHAVAVLHHDRTAFLAGIATDNASAAFRVRQQTAYSGLAQLPLGTWSYAIGQRAGDTAAEQAAGRRDGGAAVIYQVTLSYAIAGFDPRPTSRQLYLTFIRHGGHAVIASDSDLAGVGGVSWRGPWDFGPLLVGRGSHSLVLGHPGTDVASLAAQVDAAVPAVTAVWGTDWPQRAVVLVPASADELGADAAGDSDLSQDVPAETVSDGSDPLSRAALGLRLVVNPAALATLTPAGRQITLRHELTHLAAGAVTSDSSPRWLVEGFADYVGLLTSGQSPTRAAQELTTDVRAGRYPTALPTETQFDDDSTAPQAYEQGWLACRLIAARAGQAGLVRFYREVGASYDPPTAVQDALASVLHEDLPTFTAQWIAYLKQELGGA